MVCRLAPFQQAGGDEMRLAGKALGFDHFSFDAVNSSTQRAFAQHLRRPARSFTFSLQGTCLNDAQRCGQAGYAHEGQ